MNNIFPARFLEATKYSLPLYVLGATLSIIGIVTMHVFEGGGGLSEKQLLWLLIGTVVYFVVSFLDVRVIRGTSFIMLMYGISIALLVLLFLVSPIQGAKSWFSLGPLSFQPADFAKLALLALLARYFSRRHMEIKHMSHILLSGVYAGIPIFLILIQPDLGTAVIMMTVWFALVLISGLSKKHLFFAIIVGLVVASSLWFFGLKEYQRTRIVAFINPAADIRGSGYNSYQAMIAVGSGQVAGKGIGYGTQSELRFLPEYESDFIFAAFAEEWGFFGVVLVFILFTLLCLQLVVIALRSATNFDAFFTLGVLVLFSAHFFVHVGINLGLLPVTGTTIPFMSSGGSHLLLEFTLLGIVSSLASHARTTSTRAFTREIEI
jgi:rod shape determining protein RodA